jgi:RNA polymerase sigma factor (sigma-70 family)
VAGCADGPAVRIERLGGVDAMTAPRCAHSAVAGAAPAWLLAALADARLEGAAITDEAEALVVELFHREGASLVRLARLFVDDRDAAEDIVQEAFLRLARHAGRIDVLDRAPAYLRSIVLNLARDHNRRGLVSLRHQAAAGRERDVSDDVGDVLARTEEHRRLLEQVRQLPLRQRDCVTLRYLEELSIEQIAATLGVSANSVKTHLRRGMENLARALDARGGR